MSEELDSVEDLFVRALELGEEERGDFLERGCGGDTGRRELVEGLLRASASAGDFMECGPRRGVVVGGYELVEEIGRGGFSSVWRARQSGALDREVALKMVAPGMEQGEVLRRFALERQTLARLTHPGIARVFDAGMDGSGRPYFVMELVEGVTLTEFCRVEGLGLRERLGLFGEVCAAVTYAHQRGVIHRDLKPSNILAGPSGVRVIDFGIARLLGSENEGMTLAGNLVGTPQWMAPEIFEGAPADVRADVFALGLLLFELVTGNAARDGEAWRVASVGQWIRLAGVPVRPGTKDQDLNAIVMMATELDAERRYASVSDLGEDLRAWEERRPVRARVASRWYLMGSFLRRHRFEVAAVGVALAGIVGGGVVAWSKMVAADRAREASERSANRAAMTSDMFERMLFAADPERGLPEDSTLRDLIESLGDELPLEAREDPLIEHRLQRSLGDAWMGRGEWEKAAGHHARARELALGLFGPSSKELAMSLFAMGNVELQRGNAGEAGPLYLRAGEIFRGLEKEEGFVMSLRCRIQRSLALCNDGQLEEAEAVARGVIAEAERSSPEVVPRALWALGRVLSLRKDWEALTPMAMRRLEVQRALSGEDAPETWEAEAFYASALGRVGRGGEARGILEKVLDRQRAHFGSGHPTTVATVEMLEEIEEE